ncbi:MAG: SDR family oxidoreductase [Ignavibacteria bacterium]|nr:SDR family oxidoreductase [Ignavibacteria bacterium]
MINLKGKTVLITGGSRGIGKACVEYFIRAGANVALTYRVRDDRANELITNLSSQTKKIKAYKCSLESESDIISTVDKVFVDFSSIDILVSNAGIWEYGDAEKMTLENWNRTLAINLTGSMLFTREVIPFMKKIGGGKIIIITSTAGQRGEAFHSHYAASKGALISYVKSLSTELAQYNILVNSVAPGWVDTEMCDPVFCNEDYEEEVRLNIPLKKIAAPEDIAGPVLFLASDLANHITGEILNVNGGSVLCG